MWPVRLFTLECGLGPGDHTVQFSEASPDVAVHMLDFVHPTCKIGMDVDLPHIDHMYVAHSTPRVRVRFWVSKDIKDVPKFHGAGGCLPPVTIRTTQHTCFYPSYKNCKFAQRMTCGCGVHESAHNRTFVALELPMPQVARGHDDVMQWIATINRLDRNNTDTFIACNPVHNILCTMPSIESIVSKTPAVAWWAHAYTGAITSPKVPEIQLRRRIQDYGTDIALIVHTSCKFRLTMTQVKPDLKVQSVTMRWSPDSGLVMIMHSSTAIRIKSSVGPQKHHKYVVVSCYPQLNRDAPEINTAMARLHHDAPNEYAKADGKFMQAHSHNFWDSLAASFPRSEIWGGLVAGKPVHSIPQLPCSAVSHADLRMAVQRLETKLTPLQMGWALRLCDVVGECDPDAWRVVSSTLQPNSVYRRFAVIMDGTDSVDRDIHTRQVSAVGYSDTLHHSRQRRVVALAGPPGLGKSYLVAALAVSLMSAPTPPVVRIIVPRHLLAQTLDTVLTALGKDTSEMGLEALVKRANSGVMTTNELLYKMYRDWDMPPNLQVITSVCHVSALRAMPAPDIVFLEEVTTVLTPSMRHVSSKFSDRLMGVCSCKLLVMVSATIPRDSIEKTRWCAAWRVWSRIATHTLDPSTFTPRTPHPKYSAADIALLKERRELVRGVALIGSIDDADVSEALAQMPAVEWLEGGALPTHPRVAALAQGDTAIPREVLGAINVALSMCKSIPLRVHIIMKVLDIHLTNNSQHGVPDARVQEALCCVDPDTGAMPTFEVVVKRIQDLFMVCQSAAESLTDFLVNDDKDGGDDDENACAICVDSLFTQECVALKCSHVFHATCFNASVAHAHEGRPICPMCRAHNDLETDVRVIDASAFRKRPRDAEPIPEPVADARPSEVIKRAIQAVRDQTQKFTLVLVDSFSSSAITNFEKRSDVRLIMDIARDMDVRATTSLTAAMANPDCRGLLVLPMAFHTGLNLHTLCDGVVVVGHAHPDGPSQAMRTQIEGRIRRMGQTSQRLCATYVRSVEQQ